MTYSTERVVTAALYLFRKVTVRKRISLTEFKVVLIEIKGFPPYDK